jgi:hypothetical protein
MIDTAGSCFSISTRPEQRHILFNGTRLFKSLKVYFDTPKEQRLGGTWFVQTFEEEMRQLGVGNGEIAKMIMIL